MSAKIMLYGHAKCPTVPLARTMLERAGAEFEYINIDTNEAARLRVREINRGYESVPTLVFPDGSTLTEPSTRTLKHKLAAMGYEFQPPAWLGAFENLVKRISRRSS
jgi:mycoredoxin